MNDKTICPCCRKYHFENEDFYETCPVCGWQDDLVQRNEPDYEGGANELSLNEFRKEWRSKKQTAIA